MLNPGCHFLATNSSASGGPYSGPVAGNQTYSTGITDDGGIALTMANDAIVDQVGMSAGSAFGEGTRLASLGSSNQNRSYERKPGGAAGSGFDTDSNATDFQLIAPSDPQNLLSCIVIPPPTPIHTIQAAGATSPFEGQFVTVRGVVTARRFNNGFFIQEADAGADADPSTSEGVFVFTGSAPPAAAAVGAYVQVTGAVVEFAADPASPPMTEIGGGPIVSALSTGHALPAPVILTAAETPPSGSLTNLERHEGMRVHVDLLRVVGPTLGSISETNATGSSNGVFYGVIDGLARPFREPGVDALDPLPAGAPCCVPRFDGNPERIRVDSDGQIGAAKLEVTTGALVSNLTGPLDFGFRTWTILPDAPPAPAPVVSNLAAATPVPVPDSNEFTVASFNMERFFDTVDDPATTEPVLTLAAFNNRLNKASLVIRNVMRAPDIIGVEEVENLSTLQTLAARINVDAVAAGGPDPQYAAFLEEGNDVGGIDVGFLVKASRADVIDVTQEGNTETYINPNNGQLELLNDRPPLVLRAGVQGPAGSLPVTVIVNHLRSLSGIDDDVDNPGTPEIDPPGRRVRAKRAAQAEFLAGLIQARQAADPEERIISVGDYNAFQFSDGYVDTIGTIKGTPTSADHVVLASGDLVNPDLVDLVDLVPAAERYSYSFDGSAQVLDHILVNDHALQRFGRLHHARANADFPESYRSDATRPERLSDHDMPVAYFIFPPAVMLTLEGLNPMTVECGTSFDEPGYSASDADFGDLTSQVVVTGSVDPPLGSYTLTYSVSNGYLTTTMTRTVNVVDTRPPVISDLTASTSTLWPPNHRLDDVTVAYTATDGCSAAVCSLEVTSNEAIDDGGDGDTAPDWEVVDATTVRLRAERAGGGDGRVYTITVTCRDATGNASVASTTVTVPKSRAR